MNVHNECKLPNMYTKEGVRERSFKLAMLLIE